MSKYLFLLFTTTLLLVSCKQNTTYDYSEPKEVTLTGTIKNFEKYPDFDVVNLIVFYIGLSKSETFYSKIDSNGNYKIKFRIYFPQDVSISHKTWFQFLVHPGDSLNINFDADIDNNVDIYDNLNFSGDAFESNTQLAKYLKIYWANYLNQDDNYKYNRLLATSDFISFRDSIKNVMNERRESFIKEVKPTEEVKLWTYWNVEADYFNELLFHSYLYRESNNLQLKDWNYDDTYYSFLHKLNKIDEKILINTSMSYLLSNYFFGFYLHDKLAQKKDSTVSFAEFDSLLIFNIINYKTSNIIKQLMLTNCINWDLEKQSIILYEKNLNLLEANINKPYLIKPLKDNYRKIKEILNNPDISSKVILDSLKTSDVSEIFNSILSKHKNKVLYMDCWATWCAPCRGEMPYSKKLIEKFVGKDVEFIFLCIDSEEDKWKAIISELQIGGTHYYLNKSESSALRKILGIDGLPHYVMVGKNGTIIKQGFDIRPSSGLAEFEIQKLL
jgi:thiol-disulfide isomerase/thioredoxin